MSNLDPRGADRIREVFARVRNGDDGVADLYAQYGVVLVDGARHEGRDAIRAFYRKAIESSHPQPQVHVILETPGSKIYAAVVEVPTDQGHAHALDLFTLDDEGVSQLEIFNRKIE